MCTLSWWISAEQRGVLFNRDEKRTRSRGQPPRIQQVKGAQILAPLDPDAGGTWIGVNQSGLIVALLNNYPHYQENAPGQHSRGQFVMDLLIHARDSKHCMQLAHEQPHDSHKGFLLFTLDRHHPPQALEWQGIQLTPLTLLEAGGLPALTTSSVRREDCEAFRLPRFATTPRTPEALRALHQLHTPADPALGPLMTRPDAATDSLIEIQLDHTQARMRFQSTTNTPGEPLTLNEAIDQRLQLSSDGLTDNTPHV